LAKKRLGWKIGIAAAVLFVIFLPGITRYTQLKARQARLDSGIEKLRVDEAGLRKEQDKLQSDPTYIEKVVRDKLQVANEGETIVRINKKDGK
jgi:cell division protein FtsB